MRKKNAAPKGCKSLSAGCTVIAGGVLVRIIPGVGMYHADAAESRHAVDHAHQCSRDGLPELNEQHFQQQCRRHRQHGEELQAQVLAVLLLQAVQVRRKAVQGQPLKKGLRKKRS